MASNGDQPERAGGGADPVSDTHVPGRTSGSGTMPEGSTRRDPLHARPGASSASGDPMVGTVLLERYRVLRRIGSGGMGSVYVGEQLAVGREVALKVLRADLLGNDHVRYRFRREAEMVGRLKHPNTIQLIDYGEIPGGVAVMVTELLEGRPLNVQLDEHGPMDLPDALALGEQVARALGDAHEKGLIHRDLKPANIFLVDGTEGITAKVLDFGIARLLDDEATRITTAGQVFGTPRYMSPEQAVSTADVDHRSDLYSLGLIVYECLVGQPPFVAQTSLQYLSAHTQKTPPKLRESFPAAPVELEALIDACLDKSPDRRPATAAEVANQLAEMRAGLGGRRPGDATTGWTQSGFRVTEDEFPPARPSSGWSPVVVAVAAVLAVGILGGGLALALGLFGAPAPVVAVDPEEAGGPAGPGAEGGDEGRANAGPPEPGAVAVGPSEPAESGPTTEEAPRPMAGDTADPGPVDPDRSKPAEPSDERDRARPRAERRPRPRPRPEPRSEPPEDGTTSAPGAGVVTGPRGMVIDLGEEADVDLSALAESCRRSVLSGSGRLAVEGCPSGCAVLVDELCGGRTPTGRVPVEVGRRDVAVVCNGKVVRAGSVRVPSGRAARFSCR